MVSDRALGNCWFQMPFHICAIRKGAAQPRAPIAKTEMKREAWQGSGKVLFAHAPERIWSDTVYIKYFAPQTPYRAN